MLKMPSNAGLYQPGVEQRPDWARAEAERLRELVIDGYYDEAGYQTGGIEEIAAALRKAYERGADETCKANCCDFR
jgi:hypothetical protein